ncbi:hypothetical protein MIMGU_mgv1a021680mg [Erythranthe guttata]|uniref:F-box domain-containing protein n=1 Tax=Erythranthe guttata TaxID=4155 RepID=A0A022Q6H7_ERYGU|nr:hypothetical protein MIMGU_mgv1a021680mg [Erythranthe guttata]
MKRAKGGDCSNSTDRISDLPEGILQRIFYFLSQKEAVRTSLLSKSWRNNWCTRPNLFLSDATFKDNKHEFVSVVDNALRRYRDQRMCVEIFHLCTSLDYSDSESVTILDKWIRAVRNMGVKKFRLSNFSKRKRSRVVEVPSGVFEAESLQGLHLNRFKLDEKSIERIVLFKHLKTLCLVQISVHEEVFHKVISCCPMIETLEVTRCKRLKTIKVSDLHNLTNFTFSMCGCPPSKKLHTIEIHTPSIKTVKISEGNIRWFHKGADFRNLQDLTLWGVDSSLEHLSSCKFPNLESLSLLWCDRMEEIKLFIDAPNIRKFDFIGDSVPSISFATTSSKWDCSVIHVRYDISDLTSLWFLKLKELLNCGGELHELEVRFIFASVSFKRRDYYLSSKKRRRLPLRRERGDGKDRVSVEDSNAERERKRILAVVVARAG